MSRVLPITKGKNNPLLRKKAREIKTISPELLAVVSAMEITMREANGIGLAAPQVGQDIQLFVVDPLAFDRERSKWEFKKIIQPDITKPVAFINPSISSYPKGEESMIEGCLSLPDWEGEVTRSKRITIKAQTIAGEGFKLQAKGLLAKVLQHEYDHLQGVLICDKWEKEHKVQKAKIRRIVFFGDSEYSQVVLDKLKGTPYEPEIIIGKDTKYSILNTRYSLGIVASYGNIIPEAVIKKFKHGILNIHPSLLPHYRGPSPLQAAILHGDAKIGVSIMKMVSAIDAGPLLAQGQLVLDESLTSHSLGKILFAEGAQLLLEVLPEYLAGKLPLIAQDEERAIYTQLIKKEDGLIDWRGNAEHIERMVRAYQPWPIATTFFEHRGKTLRLHILEVQVIEKLTLNSEVGKLETVNQQLRVRCGKGILLIKKLRPEGKKEMTGEAFLRGYAPKLFFRHPV